MTDTAAAIAAARERERQEYWAAKGKPKSRTVTSVVCDVCRKTEGTFEWAGKRLVHVRCPGPRQVVPRTAAKENVVATGKTSIEEEKP